MIDETLSQLRQKAQYCAFSALLGIEVEELSPGYARVSATVRPEHFNFSGKLHGGFLMSLADQAFALACHSVPRNYVGVQFDMHFIATLPVGSQLFAQGRVIHEGSTMGVVVITVEDAQGKLLATATGTALALNSPPAP